MNNYDLAYIINSNNFIKNIIYYEEIASTNSVAKEILNNANLQIDNFLMLSNSQTNGRGKGDSYFFSPAEFGLYMSIVLVRPHYDLKLISIAVSLAILKSIEAFVDADVKIKWPNDILINNKKVCGILIESAARPKSIIADYAIIGIGLNINNDDFDLKIKDIATSLKMESGKTIDRNLVVVEILNALKELLLNNLKELFDEYLMNLEEKSLKKISQCDVL